MQLPFALTALQSVAQLFKDAIAGEEARMGALRARLDFAPAPQPVVEVLDGAGFSVGYDPDELGACENDYDDYNRNAGGPR